MYPPGAFPCLEVVFIVKRDFAYFLMQYYITSALFVVLSWVSFWISVDAVVARVIIGLVTVLTLTMQSSGARDQLPRVSYVKAIDIWMSTCLVFAFASLIEFAVVNVWSRRDARRSRASAAIAALRRRSSVAAVAAVFGRRGPMPMPPPVHGRRSPSPADQQQQPQQPQQLVDGLKPSSTGGASQLQPPDNAIHVRVRRMRVPHTLRLLKRFQFFLVHGQVTIIFVVSVCLFVCAEFFSATFDPISIKLGHMLYVWV